MLKALRAAMTAKGGDSEAQAEAQRVRTAVTLALLVLVGLAALLVYAIGESGAVVAAVTLTAGAAGVAGGFLGFLFGIPKTLTVQRAAAAAAAGDAGTGGQERRGVLPNTNLEEISDWLTKILVGVGLVQLGQIRDGVRDLVDFLAPSLGEGASAPEGLTLVVLIYFVTVGFLSGYLWTRLSLQRAFAQADFAAQSLTQAVAKEVAKKEDVDALALALVSSQLGPEEPEVDPKKLKDAIAAASRPMKVQIFNLARDYRRRAAAKDKDRAIPVFLALIAADPEERYHRAFAELAYALKDKDPPDWQQAEQGLDKAIEIRDRSRPGTARMYEYNRALCRIEQDPGFLRGAASDDDARGRILDDLETAAQSNWVKGAIRREIKREDALTDWLAYNKVDVEKLVG